MKTRVICSNHHINIVLGLILSFLLTGTASANTQLVLTRDTPPGGEYKGMVDLTAIPGFDAARVTIAVDGEKIAEALPSPYRVSVDFGAAAVQHRIVVTAFTADKKRVQWQQTINKGHLPLSVKIKEIDAANRVFEAKVTAPAFDTVLGSKPLSCRMIEAMR